MPVQNVPPLARRLTTMAVTSLTLVALTACGASFDGTRHAVQNAVLDGNYRSLALSYLDDNGNPHYDTDSLIDMLIAGKAFHDAGYWKLSSQAFSRAERKLLWKADTVDTPAEFAQIVAQTLLNDTIGSYRGHIYEGVLINYYQALNAMMLGRQDIARVAFNRAQQRQLNAQIQLEDLRKLSRQASIDAQNHVRDSFDSDSLNRSISDAKKQFRHTSSRASGVRNNAVDTASLLFRLTSNAQQDATAISKLTNTALASASSQNARRLIASAATNNEDSSNSLIVIYEDGIGPSLIENKLDIWLNQRYAGYHYSGTAITYAGLALPGFVNGSQGPGYLTVSADQNSATTIPLTLIDNHAKDEFDARFDAILARALISAFLKVIGQSVVNAALTPDPDDSSAAAARSIVSALTGIFTRNVLTKADTRAWVNLPQSIQIAIMPKPRNNKATLSTDARNSLRITLPPSGENDTILILARTARANGSITAYSNVLGRPQIGAPANPEPLHLLQ